MIRQSIEDLMELLTIDGPPGNEAKVVDYLRAELVAIGVPEDKIRCDNAQVQSEYGGEIGNLIVTIDGSRKEPRRMFSTHLDTVHIAVGCKPRHDRDGDCIVNDASGRALGGDNRCGCAILLALVRQLILLKGDHAPVTLVFFIQEEVGLVGARGLDLTMLGDPFPDWCVNLDGGPVHDLVTAVTGTRRFTIDIKGIPTHAGRPGGGVNAALIMAHALADLDLSGWNGRVEKSGKSGSANVGIVRGGQGSNVVMPDLHILAEARSHDPEFRQQIVDVWEQAFLNSTKNLTNDSGESGSISFCPGPSYESFALSDDELIVQKTISAAQGCGFEITPVSNDGGMDANQIVAHGIPTVTVAVGQRQVHTADEWIHLGDFEKACHLVVALGTAPLVNPATHKGTPIRADDKRLSPIENPN